MDLDEPLDTSTRWNISFQGRPKMPVKRQLSGGCSNAKTALPNPPKLSTAITVMPDVYGLPCRHVTAYIV